MSFPLVLELASGLPLTAKQQVLSAVIYPAVYDWIPDCGGCCHEVRQGAAAKMFPGVEAVGSLLLPGGDSLRLGVLQEM